MGQFSANDPPCFAYRVFSTRKSWRIRLKKPGNRVQNKWILSLSKKSDWELKAHLAAVQEALNKPTFVAPNKQPMGLFASCVGSDQGAMHIFLLEKREN